MDRQVALWEEIFERRGRVNAIAGGAWRERPGAFEIEIHARDGGAGARDDVDAVFDRLSSGMRAGGLEDFIGLHGPLFALGRPTEEEHAGKIAFNAAGAFD